MGTDSPLQLLFLGTGTSTGLPLTPCLTLSAPYPEQFTSHVPLPPPSTEKGAYNPDGSWPSNIPCACCRSSVNPDVPEGWKNKRGNTSVVVRKKGGDGKWKNVVVDVGKTFMEQTKRFFPRWRVQTIDAVILTHGHADAYFGLDDLREWCLRQHTQIPIYLNQPTYDNVAASFPYLVDKTKASGGGDIPTLTWHIIEDDASFEVCGIHVQSLPVHHGVYFTPPPLPIPTKHVFARTPSPTAIAKPEPLICLAFKFDDSIVYMADVSEIPERTWDRLLGSAIQTGETNGNGTHVSNGDATPSKAKSKQSPSATRSSSRLTNGVSKMAISPPASSTTIPSATSLTADQTPTRLPILIIDALWPLRSHSSHFSLAQALNASLRLQPSVTYLLGSTHPTTHFMWEEICLSFRGLDGRREHPDQKVTKGLVKRVWQSGDIGRGLGEKVREVGMRVEPAWDGLVVQVGGDSGEEGWREVDGPQGSAGGWGI